MGKSYLDIYDGRNGSQVFTYTYTTPSTIARIKLLPDNVTLVLGLENGAIALFNVNAKTFGSLYTAHTVRTNSFGLTPDGLFVASLSLDATVILWAWSTMSLSKVNQFAIVGPVQSGVFISAAFRSMHLFLFIIHHRCFSNLKSVDLKTTRFFFEKDVCCSDVEGHTKQIEKFEKIF
jgi:WD40 repeat protein